MRPIAFGSQEESEYSRETRIIRVAGRTLAVWFDPFRMLRQQGIVYFALERVIGGSVHREIGKRCRVHRQHHTFSRCGTGLKISFQLLPELKSAMFNTSNGSCWRRRARNQFRDFF